MIGGHSLDEIMLYLAVAFSLNILFGQSYVLIQLSIHHLEISTPNLFWYELGNFGYNVKFSHMNFINGWQIPFIKAVATRSSLFEGKICWNVDMNGLFTKEVSIQSWGWEWPSMLTHLKNKYFTTVNVYLNYFNSNGEKSCKCFVVIHRSTWWRTKNIYSVGNSVCYWNKNGRKEAAGAIMYG